jgi:antitoxin VapB
MLTTKVFTNGNSQAVRIPAEYRINEDEILIQRVGSTLLLLPKEDVWKAFQHGINSFSDDFMPNRRQPAPQERAAFDEV